MAGGTGHLPEVRPGRGPGGHPEGARWKVAAAVVSCLRRDRILHEALTSRPDPLHLSLMFGISERPASQYARIACNLLAEPPGQEADAQYDLGERE